MLLVEKFLTNKHVKGSTIRLRVQITSKNERNLHHQVLHRLFFLWLLAILLHKGGCLLQEVQSLSLSDVIVVEAMVKLGVANHYFFLWGFGSLEEAQHTLVRLLEFLLMSVFILYLIVVDIKLINKGELTLFVCCN